ncbi:uncharacterized protein A1O5_13041, partial [Cladophialophora psammophila CBS 110553]
MAAQWQLLASCAEFSTGESKTVAKSYTERLARLGSDSSVAVVFLSRSRETAQKTIDKEKRFQPTTAIATKAFDDEKGFDTTHGPASDESQLYNNTVVHHDNGIFSKLRQLEARMDEKLAVDEEAIDRKRGGSSSSQNLGAFCLF